MKSVKRIITIVIAIGMLAVTSFGGTVMAADAQDITIKVAQDDLLDIVLTLGQTTTDVSTFQADLTNALKTLGVPESKIQIKAIDTNAVSAGNTSSGWKIYDHYGNYGEQNYPAPDTAYSSTNHIIVKNGGAWISFYGYGDNPFVDFMYMPNTDSTKKTFSFTMDDNNVNNHSMFGGGFLFNTNITNINSYASQQTAPHSIVTDAALTNQYISGYLMMMFKAGTGSYPILYKINNVRLKEFHDTISGEGDFMNPDSPGAGISVLQRYTANEMSGTHSITMEVSGNTVSMTDTVSGTTKTLSYTGLSDTGSYGFGPVGLYKTSGHSCNMVSWFNFQNLQMQTTSVKKFSEVIREPQWRDQSKRFVINAQDGAVSDFSDPKALGEILARLGNENIYYLGWGNNETDANAFIQKNDNRGTFVDKDVTTTYAAQIQALASYIYSIYNENVQNDIEYLIYGKPSSLSIQPESEKTNTADAQWPNGKWKVVQTQIYQNPTGTVPYNNANLNNLDISFPEVGKYEIYYKYVDGQTNTPVKTVYVHRKPIASFGVSVDGSYNVSITDNAYDPDRQTDPDKGIKSESWQYRETTSQDWTEGKPSSFAAGKNYVIKQVVTDEYGVKSDPYIRYISTETPTAGSPSTPVAEFQVTPGRLLTYQSQTTAAYSDTSYDPTGQSITARTWTVTKDGSAVYGPSATPMTDFSAAAAGTYKITLKVKNSTGTDSAVVARYLTVIRDTTKPTATCNAANSSTYHSPKTITLTFGDEAGGSGFSHRFAVVNSSAADPTDWGPMGTNNVYSTEISQLGANYIHYKVVDYANNFTIGTFGPFTLSDTSAPSAPTITASPDYTDGSWLDCDVRFTASGSKDDFTADEDIVYEVSTDGVTFTPGASIMTASGQGTYTYYFRVTDGSGHSTTVTKTFKEDRIVPSLPAISMQSGGSAYTNGTWATENVVVTLSGSTDADSGLKGYQYKIDSGEWQNGSTYTFNASGEHTLWYRAVDNAGNASISLRTVRLDLEAPGEPTIDVSPSYTSEWTNKTVTVTASMSTDDITPTGDLVYEKSENGTDYTPGSSLTLSTEGAHTVSFRVTDVGGNSTVVTKTVKIDKTAPTGPDIDMQSAGSEYIGGTWAAGNVDITLSGSADTYSGFAGYQYKIDGGEWQDGSTYTFNASGEHTFYYRAHDNAGNFTAEGSKTIRLDLAAPGEPTIDVTPSFATEWTNKTETITASMSSDDITPEGDIVYEHSENGTDFIAGGSVTLSSQGVHTVWFRVTDVGGNSTVVSKTIKVDKIAPSGPDITMEAGGIAYTADTWATDKVKITLGGSSDADSGLDRYQYKIDNGEWQDGDSHTFGTSGVYTLSYRAFDKAGNVTETKSKTIKVDLEAPEAFTMTASATAIDTISVSAATTDLQSGMAGYRVYNGTTWSDWKPSMNEILTGYSRGQSVTISVEAKDNAGNVRSVDANVTTPQNSVPEAVSDAITLKEDSGKTALGVLLNDKDADTGHADGETLIVTAVSALSKDAAGTLALENGAVCFTPAADFNGAASFNYTLQDGHGAGATGFVTLMVTPVNDAPAAVGDSISTDEDKEIMISVLSNDSDIDSTIAIKSIGGALKGTVSKSGNSIKYTPAKDFNGSDSFTYTITDGQYDATATVRVTVRAVNDAPVAAADGANAYYMESVTIDALANDTDIDGDALKITNVSAAQNGKTVISGGKLVYTPAEGFTGKDTFTYTVSDGTVESSAGVTVTVSYPEFYNNKTTAVFNLGGSFVNNSRPGGNNNGQGTTGQQGGLSGGQTPGTGELTIVSQPSGGTVSMAGGSAYYTPAAGTTGIDTYRVTIDTGNGNVEYQVVTNTDPETGETTTVGYGVPLSDENFSADSGEVRIDLAEYLGENYDENAVITIDGQPVNGSVEIKDGVLVYHPENGFTGLDAVVFTMKVGDEQVPFAATFNVEGTKQPLFSLWCVAGWAIAALLLTLNYLKHRDYFSEIRRRTIVYIVGSVVLLVMLCWARIYVGFLVTGLAALVYVAAWYLYAEYMQRRRKVRSDIF